MAKPIDEMSEKNIAQELANFEAHRLSGDPTKKMKFQQNKPRYLALLAANEKQSGFRLQTSLDAIASATRAGRFSCYKDIADANGMDWDKAYRRINGHLWDLVSWSHDQFGFMISAVIVNKERLNDGRMEESTLAGFTRAAEELGFAVTDAHAFLRAQQRQVFEHFGATPPGSGR